MNELKIYRDGRYDTMANLKMKARNLARQKTIEITSTIDYFFTSYGRV